MNEEEQDGLEIDTDHHFEAIESEILQPAEDAFDQEDFDDDFDEDFAEEADDGYDTHSTEIAGT